MSPFTITPSISVFPPGLNGLAAISVQVVLKKSETIIPGERSVPRTVSWRKIIDTMLIPMVVLLPASIMKKMEEYGCPKSIASFVIPTGYSFNLAGSTLYQAIAVVFIAQISNVHLTFREEFNILIALTLTSKGIAGVPGVSLIVLLATLRAVGIPTYGIMLVAGIDRILDMGRTAVNVIGNALAVVVISKWEGQLNCRKENILREREKVV